MSDRAQDTLADALIGDLGVCIDVEAVRDVPVLQPGFEGMLDYEFDRTLWWWFIDTFVDDRNERERIHRAADEIRDVFLDLARLHYALTGEPTLLPEPLIRCLERRLVCAMRPSAREIAVGAKKHPVALASKSLQRLTTEESWRTR